ncbi:hypothetical protein WICPIJ_001549 [Wickerhamomyces pijperi]|uniref:Leucine aminopeptidase 2 n=1 Tax=Wickerhamomyces pijperi TaxID=599730 RepID=A0A9P8TQN0_WICPI|nr:hypothetical protein WICPIJ_001549 [Wickerhamomyces pijperi]
MTTLRLPKIVKERLPSTTPEYDFSSLSNYKNFSVRNTELDLTLDFENKKIVGSVKYHLTVLKSTEQIVLDSSYLQINQVQIDNEIVPFEVKQRVEPRGCAVEISASASALTKDTETVVTVDFETTDKSTAIQWLRTHAKEGVDYIFTQLEPNHARSLLPCFDTPTIKSTFTAKIHSVHPVVFSGLPIIDQQSSTDVYHFKQTVPIPSYLIAIASGNITSAQVGPRSTVYAEPELLEASKKEFSRDIEKFIIAAESIAGPYIWGSYDFLVNPASFPYGGMENPNITFLTPTLISGDKSQVNVIAHELAHSWSGNNVTNASWEHFWLNEGWTVYLERRIIASLHPEPEKARGFEFLMGWNDLVNSIDALPKFEYSRLIQDLKQGEIDPDDTFSSVPYEKGANFIYHLETQLGGLVEFDPYIKFYFSKFSKQSIDSYQFIDSLYEFFPTKHAVLDSIDWELWLYTPGLPPKADFNSELVDNVSKLSNEWIKQTEELTTELQFIEYFNGGDKNEIYNEFSSEQKIFFLDSLLEPLSSSKPTLYQDNPHAVSAFIQLYPDLQTTNNTEIKFRLFKLKIQAQLATYYQDLATWLSSVGRMKYVRPGYKMLNDVDRELAVDTFKKHELFYHPICANLVKKDLGL